MSRRAHLVLVSLIILKIGWFHGYRRFLLSTWQTPERRGRVDNLLWGTFRTLWMRLEYYKEKDPETREAKKALLMGGEGGREWARDYDSTRLEDSFAASLGRLTMWEALPVYAAVQDILRRVPEDQP